MAKKYNFLENIGLGSIVGIILLLTIPFAVILDGWVLSKLWQWFLIDLGLPKISIARAIGISTIFALISNRYDRSRKDEADSKATAAQIGRLFRWMFINPLFSIAYGYVVHSFL